MLAVSDVCGGGCCGVVDGVAARRRHCVVCVCVCECVVCCVALVGTFLCGNSIKCTAGGGVGGCGVGGGDCVVYAVG